MNKRRFQPRKVKSKELIRFRGLSDSDASHNVPDQYVGSQNNIESTKIRRLDHRTGHVLDDFITDGNYDAGINTASKHISGTILGEGTRLWAELRRIFARGVIDDYTPPVIPSAPDIPVIPNPNPPDFPEPDVPVPPPVPVLPPLDIPDLPGADISMSIAPEEFKVYAVEGYNPDDTEFELVVEFDNIDDLSTQGEVEARVISYFDTNLLQLGELTFEII